MAVLAGVNITLRFSRWSATTVEPKADCYVLRFGMTKYFKVTERELKVLKAVSDSMFSMAGCCDEDFCTEATKGKAAIDSILKRHGLERINGEYEQK